MTGHLSVVVPVLFTIPWTMEVDLNRKILSSPYIQDIFAENWTGPACSVMGNGTMAGIGQYDEYLYTRSWNCY